MSKLTKAVFDGNFILNGEYYMIDLNTRNLLGIKELELKQYCKLDKIQELILEQNCIQRLEETFRNMTYLKVLELSLNQIQVIENLELPMLEQLNISCNFIKEVPALQMPRLKQLNLAFNQINYVADLNLPYLETLNLAGNQLIYLPKLNQCPRLRTLDIQKNNLISITRLMGSCSYLQNLVAAYNQIPGEYMEELCAVVQSLPNLDNVDFKGNPVSQVSAYEIRLLRAKPGLKYIDNIHLTDNIIQNLRNMDKTKTYNDLVEVTKDQYRKWNEEREDVRRVLQKELNLQKLKLDFQFEDKEEDNIKEMKDFFEFIKALEAKKKRGEKIDLDEQTLNTWKLKLQQNENQRIVAHNQNKLQQQRNEEQRINNYLSTKNANQKLYDIAINEPDMWRELKRKELVQIPQEQSDEPSSEMRSLNSLDTPQESGSRSGNQSVRSGRSRY